MRAPPPGRRWPLTSPLSSSQQHAAPCAGLLPPAMPPTRSDSLSQVDLFHAAGASYAGSAAGLYSVALAHAAVGVAKRQPSLLSKALELLQSAGTAELTNAGARTGRPVPADLAWPGRLPWKPRGSSAAPTGSRRHRERRKGHRKRRKERLDCIPTHTRSAGDGKQARQPTEARVRRAVAAAAMASTRAT